MAKLQNTDAPHPFEEQMNKQQGVSYRKTLIYGISGSGKTHLLGTAGDDPRLSPMLVLDFEGNAKVTLKGVDPEKVKVVEVRTWDDFSAAYDYLMSGRSPFKSVAVDSVSETHIHALMTMAENEVAKSDKRENVYEISQRDYGLALVQMRKFLRVFRELPMHVFFTALMKQETVAREGLVKKPMLFGQLSDEIIGNMTAVIYLGQVEEGDVMQRILFLQNTPGIRCKVNMPWGMKAPSEVPINEFDGMAKLFDAMGEPMLTGGA